MGYVKYKSNCKACQLSKRDAKARARIRYAAFRREEGDETLAQIALEYGISQGPMYNHAKKHITDAESNTARTKQVIVARKTAEFKAKAQKELELKVDSDDFEELEGRPAEIIALDDYIAQGAAEIKEGKLKLTANSFLAAVKIKTDWASKQQNNKIELLKTISAFRSGSKKQIESIKEGEIVDGATTRGLTEGDNRGEDEAGSIYREAFGYAAPRGTEELPTRDNKALVQD